MEHKKYLIARYQHNGVELISCGHTSLEVNEKLQDSLRLWFVSADMFNDVNSPNDPSHFLRLAHDALEKAKVEDRLKVFDLSGMSDIFERRKRISEISSVNTSTDTLRQWACLWQIAQTTTGGLLGDVPTVEELRWLVIDTGFYITKFNPCQNHPNSIDQKEQLICELIKHFDVALKFGAPKKVLLLLAEIIKGLIAKLNEAKGDFGHLSIEQLEEKLMRQVSLESFNEFSEMKFSIAGPSADDFRKLIDLRKSDSSKVYEVNPKFQISSGLRHYMSFVEDSN